MEILAIALQFAGSWVTLLITGRLFDLVNSDTQATWKEDALAA